VVATAEDVELHLGDHVFGLSDEAALALADALADAVACRLTLAHERARRQS